MTVQELVVNLQALHLRAVHAVAALDDARMHREARISGDVEHARDDVFDVGREAASEWVGEMVDAVARLVAPRCDSAQRELPATPAEVDALARRVTQAHARLQTYARVMSGTCWHSVGGDTLGALRPLYAEAVAEARAAEAAFFAAVTEAATVEVAA